MSLNVLLCTPLIVFQIPLSASCTSKCQWMHTQHRQKALFCSPAFNYTLNTEIIKRYDLIAEVSPTISGLKLFFLFNKQNTVLHSSCGALHSILVACRPLLCWILKRPEGKWKCIGHVSRGVVVPLLCSRNKTQGVQVRRENYWKPENLWFLPCPLHFCANGGQTASKKNVFPKS